MLYLLRHGLDDETYLGGWSDVDLIEEGIKQVEVSTLKMKELNLKIDKIIASFKTLLFGVIPNISSFILMSFTFSPLRFKSSTFFIYDSSFHHFN